MAHFEFEIFYVYILYMPIPQPKDNEKQGDYMGRCMDFLSKEERIDRPQKQKVAICLNTFNAPKKKTKGNSVEIDFSEKIKEMKEKKAQELAKKEEPIKVEEPKIEPLNNAVTAPAEPVIEVPVAEAPKVETPVLESPVTESKTEEKKDEQKS
jgi:hypothetical protein